MYGGGRAMWYPGRGSFLLGSAELAETCRFINTKKLFFDILLTVHLNIFILILANLMH